MPTAKYKTYPHHVRACLLSVAKDDGDWKAVAELYNAAGAHVGAVPYRLVKGKNIHVIAVISSSGLANQESQFGSFTADLANEFIRRFLRHISTTMPLDEVVVVLDNAPCHTDAEDVFDEEEFEDAEVLKLRPYSPMLNPIENVFSVYKSGNQ
ncbi:Hypothetical protein PHPALM_9751 [Phytophthora palmivora]|uniref:Tc1-like transposase DDE domain-containing protein n=1 Tax=Phytophthora palmivora TaxID=4796 RepID=A0A2P4Y6G7_9STRA|nr:Hypothetical protein PHPALM_9751 [Phytophthora palmivora]